MVMNDHEINYVGVCDYRDRKQIKIKNKKN